MTTVDRNSFRSLVTTRVTLAKWKDRNEFRSTKAQKKDRNDRATEPALHGGEKRLSQRCFVFPLHLKSTRIPFSAREKKLARVAESAKSPSCLTVVLVARMNVERGVQSMAGRITSFSQNRLSCFTTSRNFSTLTGFEMKASTRSI